MPDPAAPDTVEGAASPQPAREVLVQRLVDGVTVVRLHRPEATNALSPTLQAQLAHVFAELAADVVLTRTSQQQQQQVDDSEDSAARVFKFGAGSQVLAACEI